MISERRKHLFHVISHWACIGEGTDNGACSGISTVWPHFAFRNSEKSCTILKQGILAAVAEEVLKSAIA